MRFQEIVERYQRVAEADAATRRAYQLSDDRLVLIEVVSLGPNENPNPEVRMGVMSLHPEGRRAPWGELTPREFMKMAEIRSMIDDWVAGKTETLPASTTEIPSRDRFR